MIKSDKTLFLSFNKALSYKKFMVNDPDVYNLIENKGKSIKSISGIVFGYLALSILIQQTALSKLLKNRSRVWTLAYYGGVYIVGSFMIGELMYTEEIKEQSYKLAVKHHDYLLSIDPKLKKIYDNYQKSDISNEFLKESDKWLII